MLQWSRIGPLGAVKVVKLRIALDRKFQASSLIPRPPHVQTPGGISLSA